MRFYGVTARGRQAWFPLIQLRLTGIAGKALYPSPRWGEGFQEFQGGPVGAALFVFSSGRMT